MKVCTMVLSNSDQVSRALSVYNIGPFSCILGCNTVHMAQGTQGRGGGEGGEGEGVDRLEITASD